MNDFVRLFPAAFLAALLPVVSAAGSLQSHHDISCAICHPVTSTSGRSTAARSKAQANCAGCHESKGSGSVGGTLGFHDGDGRECTACHKFHSPLTISAGDDRFSVQVERKTVEYVCSSCHSASSHLSELSEGHRQAAEVFHSEGWMQTSLSPSSICLSCHAEGGSRNKTVSTAHVTAPYQFDEHGSHPVGVTVVAGSGEPGNRIRSDVDPRLKLFDGRIECQTCHELTGGAPQRLVAFASRTELCLGCHALS
jgi:predicted CXXCH cytochrome family protein